MSDLISRSALIEALHEDRKSICSHVFCHVPLCSFEEFGMDLKTLIMNQPTVESQPVVRGSWKTEFTALLVVYRCSECNCATALGQTNFCPNCGCSMKKE